jgi:hypothetical protein
MTLIQIRPSDSGHQQGGDHRAGAHEEMTKGKGFWYDLSMSQFKGRIAEILTGSTGEVKI